MDGVTSLDALLPSPQGPQSQPPVIPMPSISAPGYSAMAPTFTPSVPVMRYMVGNLSLYIAFFLAVVVVSLSTPRNLILQYVPNAYTSGGVLSWTGAAVVGLAAVVLSQFFQNFLSSFI